MYIPRFQSLWQYVEYWSQFDKNFPALRQGSRVISSIDFEKLTNKLAESFLNLGIKKGDRIATILPASIDYVLSLIAAGKTGAILVPLDVKFRTEDIKRILSHVSPKIIIALPNFEDFDISDTLLKLETETDGVEKILVGSPKFGLSFEELLYTDLNLDEELKLAKLEQDKDDGGLIIFSGGTTGIPKAALLSNENMALMAYLQQGYFMKFLSPFGITDRIKTVAALPPSHVGGTLELIGTAIVGGYEMMLLDKWSPTEYLEIIQREKVPFVGGVPTMYAIMSSVPEIDSYDLSAVRLAIMGGEKVSIELLQRVKETITESIANEYGSTEGGAVVTYTDPSDDIEKIADGYVGRFLPTVKYNIVDEEDRILPKGERGELIISGPLAIKSYYKMPEVDKTEFTKDGWVRTGDIAYLDDNGGLYIVGRKKQIIRVGSYTVLPTEIEEVVLQDPSIAVAAAIGVPDKIYGEIIWLFVTPAPGKEFDEKKIIEICKNNLAKFKVPQKIIVKEKIPVTRVGKADREALRKEVIESF
jgi:acyl-CoA synthetase (AMP-forming)/AMP-acid ligase II